MPSNIATNEEEFEQMIDTCLEASQASYAESEEFSNWMPPDGDYAFVGAGATFNPFTSKKDQRTYGILSLKLKILSGPEDKPDPSLVDREFRVQYFGNSKVDNGNLKTISRLLEGEHSADYGANARLAFNAWQGKPTPVAGKCTIKRSPKKDPKTGELTDQMWENVYINELVYLDG